MHKGYQVLLLLLWLGFCTVLVKYWPTTSGDWASWVQAIGSIGAIIFSFRLGTMQARRAREDALALHDRERRIKEDGLYLVVIQLAVESMATLVATKFSHSTFILAWQTSQAEAVESALKAFESAPIYELGSMERSRLANVIRTKSAMVYGLARHCVPAASIFDAVISDDETVSGEFLPTPGQERLFEALNIQSEALLETLTSLRREFEAQFGGSLEAVNPSRSRTGL
ncbi:hypothetical protein [Achromobacter kerstersii]